MKNWLSERVAEVIYAILLAIGNLVGLARLKSTHGKRLDKVESDLEKRVLLVRKCMTKNEALPLGTVTGAR